MPGARAEVLPEANREIQDAFDWYLDRSPQAAQAWLNEIDRAIDLLRIAPDVWPRFEAGTRRYVLHRFPFDIVYREIDSGIQIVAVAHHKRRPRYWHGRLDPTR